jgi:hypothetical protein
LDEFGDLVGGSMSQDDNFFSDEEMERFRSVGRESVTPPAGGVTLTPEQSRGWNEWVTAAIRAELSANKDVFTDAMILWVREYVTKRVSDLMTALGAETGQIEKRLRSEITALREELVQARLDISYLRGVASGRDHGGEIIDLPALPSKRAKLNG